MDAQNHQIPQIPLGLAALAGTRDFITTNEFAQIFNIQPQTVRKNFCLLGAVYGIKPIKLGNRLLWSVSQIAKILEEAR